MLNLKNYLTNDDEIWQRGSLWLGESTENIFCELSKTTWAMEINFDRVVVYD